MKQNKILVIDDDKDLCILIERELKLENYDVTIRYDGITGIDTVKKDAYQLVVLDVMLPGLSGFDVLEKIRAQNGVPVLMLTAKDSEADKVSGLRLGADDYLTKPFLMHEFTARVHSLIRRYTVLNGQNEGTSILSFSGLEINPSLRSVQVGEAEVQLTAKEFDLLYFLASNQGKIFTKQQIYNHVWQEDYAYDDRNIMSFISKLRKKIKNDRFHLDYIQTIYSIGYRFHPEA